MYMMHDAKIHAIRRLFQVVGQRPFWICFLKEQIVQFQICFDGMGQEIRQQIKNNDNNNNY